jgi:ABC-type glycerol-3-phosphate transport system substrate-binding protein
MVELFKTGGTAFLLAGPTRVVDLQASDLKGKWGMAPHPYFAGKDIVTPTDSWSIGVSAFSKKQEAAQKFAEFATMDVEGSVAASNKINLPPVNKDAFPRYIDFLDTVAPEETAGMAELLAIDTEQHSVHRPSSVGYVEFETTMNKAFTDIRNGGSVSGILDRAQDTLELNLARRK